MSDLIVPSLETRLHYGAFDWESKTWGNQVHYATNGSWLTDETQEDQ